MPEFSSFDGTRIAYHEWPGSAEVPPVVLLHGFIADSALNWVGPGVVNALTATGRRVIAADARGHGASERPYDPARYGWDTMASDVTALLDHAGVTEMDLVGYSMGGVVALQVALNDARVRRLVVGGIGSGVVEAGGLDSRVIAPDVLSAALLSEVPPDPAMQADGAFRAFADLIGSDRQALAAAIAGAQPTWLPVAEVSVPTLVVAGVDDALASRPHVLANAIRGAKLILLPGDHITVLWDSGFVPAVAEFIAAFDPQ